MQHTLPDLPAPPPHNATFPPSIHTAGTETPSRTSSSYFFVKQEAEQPVVKAVEQRIRALFDRPEVGGPGRTAVVNTEALQGEGVRALEGGLRAAHWAHQEAEGACCLIGC